MFRNYRQCYCMNNNYQNNSKCTNELIETKCDNVSSYEEYQNECECGFDEEKSVFPENPMLAQSYVPIQYINKTFKPNVGLKMGTIFPELVSPYMPGQSMKEIAFLKKSNEIGEGCNKCR